MTEMALEFPRRQVAVIQQLAAVLLDARRQGSDNEALARSLLAGFFDLCMRTGLDRVLVELEIDLEDRSALADHPRLLPALVAQLGAIDLDDGSPRNAKIGQLADRVVAALGLTLVDEVDRGITLDDAVRVAAAAAMATIIDVELAAPHLRETIIATARARCDAAFLGAFDRMAAQLDEAGLRLLKQPKVPLHAAQAVQQVLFDARLAIVEAMSRTAIDRARDVIAAADADAAARIDQPVTHRLTPRDVAILRACDARVPKVPAMVVHALLEGLSEAAGLVWRAPERPVRAYSARGTFVVGELAEHPKFGRGNVTAVQPTRVDIEFADDTRTLVHVGPAK